MFDCIICLNEIIQCDEWTLRCNHKFHLSCFKQYVDFEFHNEKDISCPLCRSVEKLHPIRENETEIKNTIG